MRLALLKPAVGTASAVVFGYAVGSCASSLKADGPSSLDRPLPLRAEERLGNLMLGGQGIIRSSRAIGTVSRYEVWIWTSSLESCLGRASLVHQFQPRSALLERFLSWSRPDEDQARVCSVAWCSQFALNSVDYKLNSIRDSIRPGQLPKPKDGSPSTALSDRMEKVSIFSP